MPPVLGNEYRNVYVDLMPSLLSPHMTRVRCQLREPKNPTQGLNSASFHARIILPLLPLVFLAPFICVPCVRFTDFKWLVVFREPRITFLMHFNFLQYQAVSFPTITFFYYFAVPHGVPAEEALVCEIIYMKKSQDYESLLTLRYYVTMGSPSDQFQKILFIVCSDANARILIPGATLCQGSVLDFQWHHLFYCHYLAHPRGSLSLLPSSTRITY